MTKATPLLFLLLLLFTSGTTFTQVDFPAASAPARLETRIGLTNFTIDYHRPGVKGRTIFGELVPYGEVWRTGANEATRISFDRPINMLAAAVEAGTYALYTIPREGDTWTVILSRDTELWGARGYDEAMDALRGEAKVTALPERVETMELRWLDITHTSATLALEWENVRLEVPITLPTHEQVSTQIETEFDDKTTGGDYYRAARYYLDNKLDLQKAKAWMDRRQELDGDQFGVMRYHALIEKKLGNDAAAAKIMARSLELAEAAPNPHYVRMNTQTLRAWDKEKVNDLSGVQLLEQSIDYHDPQDRWGQLPTELKLYESRPGGGYRRTQLMMDEGNGNFSMQQIRGRDELTRSYTTDGCSFSLNGRTADFTPEEEQRHRLDCEAGAVYRDYYTYLWGLPMKLRDPGTRIDEQVHRVDFFGEELLEMKVTYDEQVGGDVWYFYFDPETYALSGYRFYHVEVDNDGEYILLEEEAEVNGIKIPAKRHWYTHGDRRYLGSDEVLE